MTTHKEALEAAYLAGFNASGEGYNGEYPFGDKMQDPAENRVWKKNRDNYIKEALAQPEQEPKLILDAYRIDTEFFGLYENAKDHPNAVALYRLDKQPTQQHEPVAWMDIDEKGFGYGLRYWSEPDNRHEVPLYTTPPQRKPLLIGKESTEFAKWFNAVWLGDGEQGETIPTSGKEYDEYLSQYTLAFGAWMAAKEAAHGIKE